MQFFKWFHTMKVDETSNDREQYVVHINLRVREHRVVLESVILETAASF